MSSVPDSTGVRWDFFVPDTDADKTEGVHCLRPWNKPGSLGAFLGHRKGPGTPSFALIIRCNLAAEAGI